MSVRRLTIFESMWSLWNLLKENIPAVAIIYAATVGTMYVMWLHIQFLAGLIGWHVYLIVLAVAFFAATGIILLFLVLKGDIGFRRVLLAQLRTMERAEFEKLQAKYSKLASDIAVFMADSKQTEPTAMHQDERANLLLAHARRVEESRKHSNEREARFWERFGPRIIDLKIALKKAGANVNIVEAPIWSIYNWPDSFLSDAGSEIARLSELYVGEDKYDQR